jgi:hypothetical protein
VAVWSTFRCAKIRWKSSPSNETSVRKSGGVHSPLAGGGAKTGYSSISLKAWCRGYKHKRKV